MAFLNINRQFRTIGAFVEYLDTLLAGLWVDGATFHNTYIPNIQQWRGSASMLSMQKTYENKIPAWDRGPHCYVAKGAPNPLDDGIWVMTPPNIPGIHAGICNGSASIAGSGMWGVELVGDFQFNEPTADQLDLMTDVIAALHRWRGLKTANVNAHRDCIPGRTCPGNAFYDIKDQVVRMVNTKIISSIWDLWGTAYPLPESQRGFGIPTAWHVNMTGSGRKLGEAASYPVYGANSTVTQLFQRGQILYRLGQSRIIFYDEFRVP